MASINLYVGIYYIFFYLKWSKIREHLPFALLCFSVGLYDMFAAGLYNSQSYAGGIFWQRLQLDMIGIVAIFFIWFIAIFTEQKGNRIIPLIIVWFLCLELVSLIASPNSTLSLHHPAIKDILLFNRYTITYYEGRVGVFYQVELLSTVLMFAYLCYLLLRHYQQTHYRSDLLICTCIMFYYAGVVNDSLVANQVYSFIYVSEYFFTFIILSMIYTLLNKFVNINTAYEEINANLERKVEERTHQISELNEELKLLADRDGLTGIYNRRFFNEYFEIEMKRARSFLDHRHQLGSIPSNEMNFGLALFDIDHFKYINDHYGHLVGDMVLKQISEIMESNIFSRDVLCRYGGDEFALLLTKTSHEGIFMATEKIRREIGEHHFSGESKLRGLKVTISAGLVNFDEVQDCKSEEILKIADDRLLRAKKLGRNQIVYRENA